MFHHIRAGCLKEFSHLLLCEPDSFILHAHINVRQTVFALVDQYVPVVWIVLIHILDKCVILFMFICVFVLIDSCFIYPLHI